MHRYSFIFAVILFFCPTNQSIGAETVYITDSLQITLRTGPSVENKIISLLRSGQPLEIIASEGDWSNVRTLRDGVNNKEGWILTRYLITRLPWEKQALSLTEENTKLREKLAPMEKNMNDIIQREKELNARLQNRNYEFLQLKQEFESLKQGAAGYLQLVTEHQKTKIKLESIQNQVQELRTENERLITSRRNRWFATGALVLLCGLMIGLTVGRQQKKRRSNYY